MVFSVVPKRLAREPPALVIDMVAHPHVHEDVAGMPLAAISGAATSVCADGRSLGIGYYPLLPGAVVDPILQARPPS